MRKLVLLLALAGATAAQGVGKASFYAKFFNHRMMANGHRLNQSKLTAAHRHLPFGSCVRVTDLRTRKTVHVTITDRGPWVKGRVLDLSEAAARAIGLSGVDRVTYEVVEKQECRR